MFRRISIVATLMCGAALPAWAVDVAIANAGFEQVVLPCASGRNCYSASNVASWTGTGPFYTLKPSTGPGGIFPSGVPEGVNVASLFLKGRRQPFDLIQVSIARGTSIGDGTRLAPLNPVFIIWARVPAQ